MNNDNMRPWARWMVNHKLRWLIIVIAVLLFPLYFFSYLPEAIEDFRRDIGALK